MTWDEFRENARAVGSAAAQKINELTDAASLRVHLATAESRLKAAYTKFGKAAYLHFTADESSPEELAEQVRQIALLEAEVAQLKNKIQTPENPS